MERAGTLINKLKEQFESKADPVTLAVTAQMLLAELQKTHAPCSVGSKVSVVMPAVPVSIPPNKPEEAKEIQVNKKRPIHNWLFEPANEIPTLAHQDQLSEEDREDIYEYNEALADKQENLNERLKENRVEVASTLQSAPIRDLKKAIGINDRYLFVNELFRGDENMYERSLKTINGFTIYPEAEYWIQRELKVKLSWYEQSETVKLFDQLIKRRFS